MPCEHYKNALIEAAANGAEPQGELRAHLNVCLDCRAAFEQEQSLFASIDTGLHVTANPEVPPSLLPCVRARRDDAAAPRGGWVTNWFALAGAAVMIVAFFAAHAVWRTSVIHKPVATARKTSVLPQLTPSPENRNPAVVRPVEKNPRSQRQFAISKNPRAHEKLVSGETMPEVLVPRDQEVLLAEYAEQWSLRKRPLLLAQEFDATVLSPLQVAPIQIDELGVKLLAEEKLQ